MAHYQGSDHDARRAEQLARAREKERKAFEERQQQLRTGGAGVKILAMEDKFAAAANVVYEDQFKASTVGLVSAEEYKNKKRLLERLEREEAEERSRQRRQLRARKEQDRKKKLGALSFDAEEELLGGEEPAKKKPKQPSAAAAVAVAAPAPSGNAAEQAPGPGPRSPAEAAEEKENPQAVEVVVAAAAADNGDDAPSKDPLVETGFLPDRARAQQEAILRQRLAEEWRQQQERIRKEIIEVTWSYWDGTGHRNTVKIEKGARIDQFLEACRRVVQNSFPELRGVSAANLIYVKEDLIIPHHYTFYDLIVTKARGKSGPLFHFDVHEDVRLAQDVRVEKDESHAGKVMTRAYYERNKHIFPISRFEVFDPEKTYDKYTIR